MSFEHNFHKPDTLKEDWDGQFSIFSWMQFIAAVPQVVYLVTTLKEDGLSNAALEGWSSFTGEGDHFYVMMSGLFKSSHTYKNIKRDGEFCVNFLSPKYADNLIQTIHKNEDAKDEIVESGLTPEDASTIKPKRIKEGFLKLECTFEWEKELYPDSQTVTLCGRVRYLSADEHFVSANVKERFQDSYLIHMLAMKNPFTGERLPGAIGRVEVLNDTQL